MRLQHALMTNLKLTNFPKPDLPRKSSLYYSVNAGVCRAVIDITHAAMMSWLVTMGNGSRFVTMANVLPSLWTWNLGGNP